MTPIAPLADEDLPILTQYIDPLTGRQVSTVLCGPHSGELIARLRAVGVGSGSCPAGALSTCDACVGIRHRGVRPR